MNPFLSKLIFRVIFLLVSFSMPVYADAARHCVGACDGNYYETYQIIPSDTAETSSDSAYVTKAEYLSTQTSESKSSNLPSTSISLKK